MANEIITAAKAHFAKYERRRIEVPEWPLPDGSPLVIYSSPVTLAEKQRLRQRADEGGLESLAHCLIMKAENADGKKLFTLEDKHALVNAVDPDVLARVASTIVAALSDRDLEKN